MIIKKIFFYDLLGSLKKNILVFLKKYFLRTSKKKMFFKDFQSKNLEYFEEFFPSTFNPIRSL